MTSFLDVPYNDIIYLLGKNNIPMSSQKEETYDHAWKLILKNKDNINFFVPVSIADFIIAFNNQNKNIKTYTSSSILLSSNDDILPLTKLFGFLNKERLLRILNYLGLLKDDTSKFEDLPDEVIQLILLNLDCDDIPLICNISKRFSNFCSTGKLENILREKLKTNIRLNGLNERELINFCSTHKYRNNKIYL